jgi:hypothetical protein
MKKNKQPPHQDFNLNGIYPCPVCRHGQLTAMSLMEALYCNFCNHIFTVDLQQKLLQMGDTQIALKWYWNGKKWQNRPIEGTQLGWGYGIAGIIFVVLPPTIVGASAYFFPPLPESSFLGFPVVWTILTFLAHLGFLGWLMLEFYQFPFGLYFRAIRRRWANF